MEESGNKKEKTNRPANTPFKQQRLKAWQPILTPRTVIPGFFIVGLIFLVIGPFILVASQSVVESSLVRYDTQCHVGQTCTLSLKVPAKMLKPVYVYYELDNFYQNHRRYVKSRNDAQLRGIIVDSYAALEDCAPLIAPSSDAKKPSQFYNPCGLVAASFFNDTFTNLMPKAGGATIPWTKNGIAWKSDVDVKFKDPPAGSVGVDPNTQTQINVTDPDFIVWMRTAALPRFRKLYRIINQDIPQGDYYVTVDSKFPVSTFSGKKSLIMSTASWIGGKNDFLGWAYIVVGAVSVLLAIVFTLKHKVSPRKLGDTKYLLWSK